MIWIRVGDEILHLDADDGTVNLSSTDKACDRKSGRANIEDLPQSRPKDLAKSRS